MTVVADDLEMEKADAAWAEALALRILLARVEPGQRAEAIERVQSIIREFETPRGAGSRRRLPKMSETPRRRTKRRG
jgi:hypothetical protein